MKTPLCTRGLFLLSILILSKVNSAPVEKQLKHVDAQGKPGSAIPDNKAWKVSRMVQNKEGSTLKKDETQPIRPLTPILLEKPALVLQSQSHEGKERQQTNIDVSKVVNAKGGLQFPAVQKEKPPPENTQINQQQKVQLLGKPLNQINKQIQNQDKLQETKARTTPLVNDDTKAMEKIDLSKSDKEENPVVDSNPQEQHKPVLLDDLKPTSIHLHPEQEVSGNNQDVVLDNSSSENKESSGHAQKEMYDITGTHDNQIQDDENADMMIEKKPKYGNAPFVETPSGYQVDTIDDNNGMGGDESNGLQQQNFEGGGLMGESNSFLGGSPNQMESDSYNGGMLDMNNAMTGTGEMAEALGGKNMFEGNNPIMGLGAGAMRSLDSYGGGEAGRQAISGMLGVSPMNQMNGFHGIGDPSSLAGLNGMTGLNGMAGFTAMGAMNGMAAGLGGMGASSMLGYGGHQGTNAWYKSGIMSPRRPNPRMLHYRGLAVRRMYGYPRVAVPQMVPQVMMFRPRFVGAVMGKKRGKMPRPSHKASKSKHRSQKVKEENGKTKSTIAHKHKPKKHQKKHKQVKHTNY